MSAASPSNKLDLPPDTPDWVRYRLERMHANGGLIPEEKLRQLAEGSGILHELRKALAGKPSRLTRLHEHLQRHKRS